MSLKSQRPAIAERLWEAARIEFSQRGYHGARVQGIARRAGCNVALLYRHWPSKKGLYIELLRSVWASLRENVLEGIERGRGAPAVVGAYLDAYLRDPTGAQIIVRELLEGGPYLNQLVTTDPQLLETVRCAARALAEPPNDRGTALRPGLDPTVAVLSIAGLAALIASAHETSRLFLGNALSPEGWRKHLYDLLLHGVLTGPEGGKPNDDAA